MGLIKAAAGAIGGTLADQWKDYFYCDAIDKDVLIVRGRNRASDRSSNRRGESNVISDGSGIAVADGQCMMIVEQGKVMELCAEPGVFTYRSNLTPSIFAGDLKEGLRAAARDAFERFQFGGGVGKDQRIYYFNTKEIMGNKYGTLSPVPFKVIIDKDLGKFLPIDVRCNGEYSYRIANPMLLYTKVCGNLGDEYRREEMDSQMKSELLSALQPAFARISALGVDYSEIPAYLKEIREALQDELSPQWSEFRGVELVSFGINSVSVSEADKLKVQNMHSAAIMSDPRIAAGNLAQAQADAMRMAAANESGAMTGFMGMGFASGAGGMNTADLFAQAERQEQARREAQAQVQAQQQMMQRQAAPARAEMPKANGGMGNGAPSWTCSCGAVNNGNFCMECGSPKPADGWTCSCGAVNRGKFCPECGAKKPAGASLYQCDKCGWQPEDPAHPPKFCPECGDIFDENDLK